MKRSLPTGAWIAGGLVVAALIVPGVSYATATLTELVGTNGTTAADVSKGHQLLTAEATPANFFSASTAVYGTNSTTCTALTGPTTGHGLVLRDVRYTVYDGDGTLDSALFYVGTCGASFPFARIGLNEGNGEFTLDPGVGVPAGSQIYYELQNYSEATDDAYIIIDGYQVPGADVPAASQIHGKS
jgi:hypothetical protein